MYNVDIDTGGTMTDGLVCGGGTVLALKVETTPHDVTVAFLDILKAAQREFGFADLRSFLDRVEVIRWSSTITSNVLAQRVGPKLGLLVSAGHEKDLYDEEAARAVVGVLVSAGDISGIPSDADEHELRLAIKSLLDKGIRRINVSLRDAFPDGQAERRIIDMIAQDYPDHFLGSIPALAGSDVVLRPDDSTRTVASLINAYVHPALATSLYRAEEIVRDEHGWQGNVLIGHINGGVARIGKTKAFDTIESGPLFGTHACAVTAGRFGDDKVIAIDVGGTTAKASAVRAGQVVSKESGHLFDIPLRLDMPLLRSMALGGGSVARVTDGRVVLGPDSMGAAPGPACYGLGGRNATVTDAFFLCGFISPTAFLGGKRVLDADRARTALDKHVGTPLGLAPPAAAQAVVEAAWDAVAQLARGTAEEAGWDPADCVIYAYGGNGPLFVTAVAERLGARNARFFRYGHVYSAYGSAISDVVHVYESALTDRGHLESVGAHLADQARRDLRAEGFDPSVAFLHWDVRSAKGAVQGEGELPPAPHDGEPTLVRLTARHPLPRLRQSEIDGPGETEATGGRPSPFGADGSLATYDGVELASVDLTGPLLVDGGSYTWLVTRGWSLSTDAFGDASLTRE
ncbi:hydantoinase/oxoprolinase family protein [Sphaerisporangium perillae]|uniref:hydantoinase/oxoprolinase family protein n=1 Tax=Sphaerisporangium perillae TaxID=2935860 RepID=UPI00200D7B59|nr:hydantoinase/oxoprolinase family protein [Sphaerisporangium perillae]